MASKQAAGGLIKPWKLPRQKTYVFKNANVVDTVGGTIKAGQTVKLSDGLIESIGSDIAASGEHVLVDLAGKYLCPGLIDCHVHLAVTAGMECLTSYATCKTPGWSHFRQPFLCRQMLDRGFTTVRDAGGASLELKEALHDDVFAGPRLFICSKALSQTGGHADTRPPNEPFRACCGDENIIGRVADGVPACIKAAREQLRVGADFIKIMVGGGVATPADKLLSTQFTAAEIRAVADVAESCGTYVAAHAYTPKAIRLAVDNGVTCIEHGNLIDEETARYMAERNIWLVPTLVTYAAMGDPKNSNFLPPVNAQKNNEVLPKALHALRIAEEAGLNICHGTDLLGPLHAEQSSEFSIRAQVLSSKSVLRAATATSAKLLQQEDFLGQVKQGFAADLLILNANPLDDVTILSKPKESMLAIMKNGRVYTSRWEQLAEDVQSRPSIA
ncbi:hypothetical protein CDD81_5009 [Ophiocordyceps australis]|uniref:Amidohydrolase-related domain-containing protein n=1 Tax=Ophiocordyceps australis TaxID=1399860 RepID=A0A2C5YAZ9_9HYPO|nr:hypothetical protein CDD81_5009 [Ophiocordyceps australis]